MPAGIIYYRPEDDLDWMGQFDWVVRVPVLLSKKKALLETLARELRFPPYFGANWDALRDCLTDLSWLPEQHLLLFHEDLPLAEQPEEARLYLEVLSEAEESRRATGQCRLSVAFPDSLRPRLEPEVD